MKLSEYQSKCETTAHALAYHHQYLIPGIVGEVGELFGQQAKAYWHERSGPELQDLLVKEYGDIAWMTALLLHTEGYFNVADWKPVVGFNGRLPDPMALLLGRATQLHSAWLNREEYDWLPEAAERMWQALESQCERVTGVEFDVVLQANLDKLASRAARGVLKGAGDNR